MSQEFTQTTSSKSSPNKLSFSGSWQVPTPSTVSNAMTGLLRRFSTDPLKGQTSEQTSPYLATDSRANGKDGVYTPPYRTASPFQPPPLYPLNLKERFQNSAPLLSRALAEEIRLLVPPRLQLCEEWHLTYSLEQNGVSLGTLYKRCDDLRGRRNGFVLVVKDGEGGVFGAYLTDAPHPSPHYFGTGECFLWRAQILSPDSLHNLPPPPSSDTTNMTRSTTIAAPAQSSTGSSPGLLSPAISVSNLAATSRSPLSGTSTPDRIRFKAFPYSGINDYMMLCETGFLSVGGGDGHYGLWLDGSLEKGISSHCLTFGNEPLSDDGEKFEILGVELWTIGNT